jgi:porin
MAPVAAHSADEPGCPGCVVEPAISVDAVYTAELWRAFSGGLGVGDRYLDDFALTAAVDGGQLLGLDGWQLFGAMLYNNGRQFSDDLTGSVQGITNIETLPATRLFELWTQWRARHGAGSIKFGLYDLNSEFDHIAAAELFINPSHGIGPDFSQSGENGPSIFPVTSLALRGQMLAGPWTIQAAVLDAKPGNPRHPERTDVSLSRTEGALIVGELDYRSESGARVGAGYWRYTADFDDVSLVDGAGDPLRRNDNAGAYLLIESPLLLQQGSERGLNLFARTGTAESRVNELGHYYGVGAVYSGLEGRGMPDQIGLAVAIAELGEPTRMRWIDAGDTPSRREYNYELTCRFTVSKRVALQADLQYIDNPGLSSSLPSAMMIGLRIEVAQSWEH